MKAVVTEAIKIASTNTNGFGLSIDLDAFDPEEAPGVGSPAPGGLRKADVLPQLHQFKDNPGLKALEITEFNPHLDKDNLTARLIFDIIGKLT